MLMIFVCCVTQTESVGGVVSMSMETVAQNFVISGVILQCSVERGSFPQYYWFINNTRLENQGSFFPFNLNPDTKGFYHCEAADAFNGTRLSSQKQMISKEGKGTLN